MHSTYLLPFCSPEQSHELQFHHSYLVIFFSLDKHWSCAIYFELSLFFPQESELIELRETIEMLKAQNSAAQAAIQGALNGPDHTHKGMFLSLLK